jgi:hypothetical protein
LVEIQAILTSVIESAEKCPVRIQRKSKYILYKIWDNSSPKTVPNYIKIVKLLDPSLTGLVFASVFLQYLTQKQLCPQEVAEAKKVLLENLIKIVISGKNKTLTVTLNSIRPLLVTINHDEFKGKQKTEFNSKLDEFHSKLEEFHSKLQEFHSKLEEFHSKLEEFHS